MFCRGQSTWATSVVASPPYWWGGDGISGGDFFGGERGIRTPGDREATTVFKTDAIVRSAISPLTRLAILANEFAEYDFSDKDQQHGQLQLIDYGEWRNE